jgi:hypothetical protein
MTQGSERLGAGHYIEAATPADRVTTVHELGASGGAKVSGVLAPRVLTVYRTDADLRSVDLSIDPNDRPRPSAGPD